MARYKKKPVIIEAFQYNGDLVENNGAALAPAWALEALDKGVMYYKDQGALCIKTLEGIHHVSVGDYIIQGIQGELYPCKPDIFIATYDLVDDDKTDIV